MMRGTRGSAPILAIRTHQQPWEQVSIASAGQTSYEFEYGLIGRHQGLFAFSIGLVVVGSILGYSAFSSRSLGAAGVGVGVGLLFKLLVMGVAADRINRRRLGRIRLTDTEISLDRLDGSTEVCVAAHTRAKRGRRPLPAWMPREEILHDLPEEEKVCPQDGTALVEIARESSEQIEFVPATARVLVHVRPKYGCPRCKTGVRIAPLPPQPIPKSLASPSLLAYVAVSKYADALPLYRQEAMLARLGIDLSRATLASWMVRAGELMQPLVNRMREEILDSGFVQCDESRFQVLREPGKPAESLSYVWVQRGGPVDHPLVLYEYDPSRSAEVPKRLFEGFQGVLQTDGYEGYGAIGREPGIVHVGCWAHARRKFTDATSGLLSLTSFLLDRHRFYRTLVKNAAKNAYALSWRTLPGWRGSSMQPASRSDRPSRSSTALSSSAPPSELLCS